ncbi:MAG: tyrosine-type recombinase/integrase family protein [Planctomycetes bacterium]|nr:tyrosine-type recombinase/integrase family protein [Planctomycetota bacterium]
MNEADRDEFVPADILTVGNFLTRWLADTVKPNLAPLTFVSYSRQVANHIEPRLGKLKLKSLNTLHVDQFTSAMGREGVGSCAKRYAFRVLKTALTKAVKLGLILTNPCRNATTPTHRSRKIEPFSEAEAALILDEVADDWLRVLYELAIGMGMRKSEIIGLHWEDVDFKKGTVHVHQQACFANGFKPHFRPPKTEAGRSSPRPCGPARRSRRGRPRRPWSSSGLA